MTAATAVKSAIRFTGYRLGEPTEFHVAEQLPVHPGLWARIDRTDDDCWHVRILLGQGFPMLAIQHHEAETARGAKDAVRRIVVGLADRAKAVRFRRGDPNEVDEAGERIYNKGLLEICEATSSEGKVSIVRWDMPADANRPFELTFDTPCYSIRERYKHRTMDEARACGRLLLAHGPLPADDGFLPFPGDQR